jgi:hypothetical protein
LLEVSGSQNLSSLGMGPRTLGAGGNSIQGDFLQC